MDLGNYCIVAYTRSGSVRLLQVILSYLNKMIFMLKLTYNGFTNILYCIYYSAPNVTQFLFGALDYFWDRLKFVTSSIQDIID